MNTPAPAIIKLADGTLVVFHRDGRTERVEPDGRIVPCDFFGVPLDGRESPSTKH